MEWLPLEAFLVILSSFHVSEFAFAALYSRQDLSFDSCLISLPYILAMGLAIVEYLFECFFFPALKEQTLLPGFFLVLLGEIIRKYAMVVAGRSFTHRVCLHEHPTNVLVTNGPYRCVRHPGYLGWMIWALGTQVLLWNPICAIGFLTVSWKFFQQRIAVEEDGLKLFFGDAYLAYKRRVPSCIPFTF